MMRHCFFIILFPFLFSSCYFLGPSPAKRYKQSLPAAPFDAVIVPGLPLNNGHWDTLLKARVIWSLYLYRKGIARNIIFSGNAVHGPYIESKAMAIYAQALHMDMNHVFIDTLAEHSTENVYYSYKLAQQLGFKKLAIATDPFQCFMLDKFCRTHFKTQFYLLPIVYDAIRIDMLAEPVVDTNPSFVPNFVSIEERTNYAQRLKGTRGKNISID